jgi:protein-histidine N-methyltransferase
MGCGTAIPSLVLFQYALTENLPIYFTLTDYNASALRVVTLPNLLLTWASTLPATDFPFSKDSPNPLATTDETGDLEITHELTKAFASTLANQGLTLNLISGSWSPSAPFLSLIPTAPEMNILVLASETIYSPSALSTFTEALIGILKQVRMGKAMVAAKRVYFGVGGSVDAFKIECREKAAVAYEIDNHGVDLGEKEGVRRCLVEVQMY